MVGSGSLLLPSAVEELRGDVAVMSQGLLQVMQSLLSAAERCVQMEEKIDQRQRLLEERWHHIEQTLEMKALSIGANLEERWCSIVNQLGSSNDRLLILETNMSHTLQNIFPRVEALLMKLELGQQITSHSTTLIPQQNSPPDQEKSLDIGQLVSSVSITADSQCNPLPEKMKLCGLGKPNFSASTTLIPQQNLSLSLEQKKSSGTVQPNSFVSTTSTPQQNPTSVKITSFEADKPNSSLSKTPNPQKMSPSPKQVRYEDTVAAIHMSSATVPCLSTFSPSTSKATISGKPNKSSISTSSVPSTLTSKSSSWCDKDAALRTAANVGKYAEVLHLLSCGASVNSVNLNGRSALHCAASYGSEQIINTLSQHGANVDCKDYNQLTPLHIAALRGHKQATRALLNAGASISSKDSKGKTPLDVAASDTVWDLLKSAARNHETKPTSVARYDAAGPSQHERILRLAANCGRDDKICKLLESGVAVDSVSNKGRTALHVATLNGMVSTMTLLKNNGANINATDSLRCTPLHYAAKNKHRDAVKMLLLSGANIDAKDLNGNTPDDLSGGFVSQCMRY